MLDIKFIKENSDLVRQTIKNKNIDLNLDELFEVYQEKNKLIQGVDALREKRKKTASKKI